MTAESPETPRPPENTARPTLQERARRMSGRPTGGGPGFFGFLLRAVTLVVVVLGGVYVYQQMLTTPAEPARAPVAGTPGSSNGVAHGAAKATPTPPGPEPDDLEARERRMELETAQGAQRQRLASAKLEQRRAIALGESVGQVLGAWRAELERWSKEVEPLSRDDQGRALAGNPPLLRLYRTLVARERPGRDEADRLKGHVEGLVSAVKAASENPDDASLPGPELAEQLRGLLREAKAGRDKNAELREQVASLVTQAAGEGAPSVMTLAEAAGKQQDEEHRASAAVIEAARSKAEEAATAATARAKADQIREAGVKQEAIVRAETEALSATKERERIRKLAESPAIQARFAPLFAKGRYSLASSTPSVRAVPVSLGDMNRLGYLENVEMFARTMCDSSPNGFGQSNDRPTFPKPRTEADWGRIEQDLAMFKQLGPTWVEMGKLMP